MNARAGGYVRAGGSIALALSVALVLCCAQPAQAAFEPSAAAQLEDQPLPGDGETAAPTKPVHLNAADIKRAEAKYSELLQEYRSRYRVVRMIRDQVEMRTRLSRLAKEVEGLIPDQEESEVPVWLKLQQDAFVATGKTASALAALDRRFVVLSKTWPGDRIARVALDEAVRATALKDYAIAAALYEQAQASAGTQGMLFKAVMGRGRLISEKDGMEAAIAYFQSMTTDLIDSEPELAREAHFRAAMEYYRHDQLNQAVEVLREIEARYPDTPEAEKARHTRKGWARNSEDK